MMEPKRRSLLRLHKTVSVESLRILLGEQTFPVILAAARERVAKKENGAPLEMRIKGLYVYAAPISGDGDDEEEQQEFNLSIFTGPREDSHSRCLFSDILMAKSLLKLNKVKKQERLGSVHRATYLRTSRDKTSILAKVLKVCDPMAIKTHIMYRANLSYEQLGVYIGYAVEKGLLLDRPPTVEESDSGLVPRRNCPILYSITEKGREYIHLHLAMMRVLGEPAFLDRFAPESEYVTSELK